MPTVAALQAMARRQQSIRQLFDVMGTCCLLLKDIMEEDDLVAGILASGHVAGGVDPGILVDAGGVDPGQAPASSSSAGFGASAGGQPGSAGQPLVIGAPPGLGCSLVPLRTRVDHGLGCSLVPLPRTPPGLVPPPGTPTYNEVPPPTSITEVVPEDSPGPPPPALVPKEPPGPPPPALMELRDKKRARRDGV